MEKMYFSENCGKDDINNYCKRMYIVTSIVMALVILISVFAIIHPSKSGNKATETSEVASSETIASASESSVTDEPDIITSPAESTQSSTAPNFTVTDLSATKYASINLNVRNAPGTYGGVLGSYKKGSAVTATGKCSNGWYRVDYKGTPGYCSGKYLSDTEIPVQAAVSDAPAASPTPIKTDLGKPYYLKINLTTNVVTVYGKDENGEHTVPVKAMYCSTGIGGKTPVGTFNTTNKYRWKILSGDVYGQYCTRITGHILFHSVPYNTQSNSDLNYNKYNKLGSAASAGCVRLCTADAKWIYDNCPSGTTVTTYHSTEPDPITPPSPIRIDINDERRGWDPTDPDPNNPWLIQ